MKKEIEDIVCFICEEKAKSFQSSDDWKNYTTTIRCPKCKDFQYSKEFEEDYLDMSSKETPKLKNYKPLEINAVINFLKNEITNNKLLTREAIYNFLQQ